MIEGQQVTQYNTPDVVGDPGNHWWLSFAGSDGHMGCLLTQDVEQGELHKMLDRITKAGLNPGGDDVAVFCVTAAQLRASGDEWMLDKCDEIQSHAAMAAKGSPSVFL